MRSLSFGGLALICAAALNLSLPKAAKVETSAHAGDTLEARKLPMTFTWYAARAGSCEPNCGAWINAVGVITAETPAKFEDFIKGRDMSGVTMVLDSSGGSVLDSIAIGRRWRQLGLKTSVGIVIERASIAGGVSRDLVADAYCESMCAFLLLAGTTRTVPDGARVRVHQIWMGDRADDAKAASYSAQDLMIVERDIGRLAKYTFEMGGSGDLLALALSIPPWEPLHELSADELRVTNLLPADALAVASSKLDSRKPVQDRFVGAVVSGDMQKSTKTAQADAPTGGAASTDRK